MWFGGSNIKTSRCFHTIITHPVSEFLQQRQIKIVLESVTSDLEGEYSPLSFSQSKCSINLKPCLSLAGKSPISSLIQNAFHKDSSCALYIWAILQNGRNTKWNTLQIFPSKVRSREDHSCGFKIQLHHFLTMWPCFFISRKIIITALKVYKMFNTSGLWHLISVH